jgi:hypothetical protein
MAAFGFLSNLACKDIKASVRKQGPVTKKQHRLGHGIKYLSCHSFFAAAPFSLALYFCFFICTG